VGAADQVVDTETIVKEIRQNWRKVIGVEMETYGLYRAAHESAFRPLFLAFKSVCDFAASKTDDYQPYAAYTSAHFARYFIARHWADIKAILGR
jgi:nucleoside phosphorylase